LKFKINVQGFYNKPIKKLVFYKGGEEAFPARVGRKREGALEKLEFFAYFLGQCQKV
jgi:hypothetical protein